MTSRIVNKAFCKGLAETTHSFSAGFRNATDSLFWVRAAKVSHRELKRDKSGMWRVDLASWLAPVGVCIYIAGSAASFGLRWDVPLMTLAIVGVLTLVCRVPNAGAISRRFSFGVLAFLISTALSISMSEDIGRSMRLSVPLLPGTLLFLLIAGQFRCHSHIRMVYLTFAGLGLLLASTLLWVAGTHLGMKPTDWVSGLGSPMLLVPNDVLFLGVLAPLSLALLYRSRSHVVRSAALLSLLPSLCVVGAFQSRGAVLIMLASIGGAVTLVRPRLGLACFFSILALFLLTDGLLGFPLLARICSRWTWGQRIPLWFAAATMFLDAPILGQGTHTFALHYRSYLPSGSLPDWVVQDPRLTPWPHNLYLEVLAEQGIVGLTALGFLLLSGIAMAWKVSRTGHGDVHVFAMGALVSLSSLCCAAMFELTLMRQWVVIMIFALLGVISRLSTLQTEVKIEEASRCLHQTPS